jgi:hypothetical protein
MSQIILPREPFVPGTVKPEADYEEFSRLGAKLGLPCPQAFISLESTAPDGALHDSFTDRSRTLNRNYWNWLFKLFAALVPTGSGAVSNALTADTLYGAGHMTNKNTAGTISNGSSTGWGSGPGTVSAVAVDTNGIVVGTGTGAEAFDDFALGTKIAHGNGAGQFAYNAMVQQMPSYNAGTLTWTATIVRIFNNNSGGTIVVGETGIYGLASAVSTTVPYMIMRDKLSSTVSVLNGGQLTVTYTMVLTFPA